MPLYGIEETNGGLIVFGGGVPIFSGGFFIGAVGVSGGTVDQDIQVSVFCALACAGRVQGHGWDMKLTRMQIATAGVQAVGTTS